MNLTKKEVENLGTVEFTNGSDLLELWHNGQRGTFSVHFNCECIFAGTFATAKKHMENKIQNFSMWLEID